VFFTVKNRSGDGIRFDYITDEAKCSYLPLITYSKVQSGAIKPIKGGATISKDINYIGVCKVQFADAKFPILGFIYSEPGEQRFF